MSSKYDVSKMRSIDKQQDARYRYRKYQKSIEPNNAIMTDKILSVKLRQFRDREDIDHILKYMV